MSAPTIDIVSDYVCPWCLIGTRRLDAVLASMPEVPATVTYHPFLLDPSTPPEGGDLREHLRKKYGGDPEPMFARVESAAKSSGIALDFSRIRRRCATAGAHTLTRHALAKGTQRALASALFDAYFLEGRDIGDPSVLTKLATAHGFTDEEADQLLRDRTELDRTATEAREAAKQGVTGVPFFVFNQKLAVSGAQSEDVLRQVITRAMQ